MEKEKEEKVIGLVDDKGAKNIEESSDDSVNFDIRTLKEKTKELTNSIEQSKRELITILGIFASFITFVSVEFKLFEKVVNMGDFISLSILLVSMMMFFVITLQSVIKEDNLFYKKPLFLLATSLLLISTVFYLVPRIIENQQRNQAIKGGYLYVVNP